MVSKKKKEWEIGIFLSYLVLIDFSTRNNSSSIRAQKLQNSS